MTFRFPHPALSSPNEIKHGVRGTTKANINHLIVSTLNKKSNIIILYVGIYESVFRTSPEVLDDLF